MQMDMSAHACMPTMYHVCWSVWNRYYYSFCFRHGLKLLISTVGGSRRSILLSLYCKSKSSSHLSNRINMNKESACFSIKINIYMYIPCLLLSFTCFEHTHTRTLNNIQRSQKREKERKKTEIGNNSKNKILAAVAASRGIKQTRVRSTRYSAGTRMSTMLKHTSIISRSFVIIIIDNQRLIDSI